MASAMITASGLVLIAALVQWLGILAGWIVALRIARKDKHFGPSMITFMVGLSIFQGVSPTLTAILGETHGFHIADVEGAYGTFCTAFVAFLAFMLIGYRYWGAAPTRVTRIFFEKTAPVSEGMLIATAVALTVIAGLLRVTVSVELISDLAYFASVGAAATACAIVGWTIANGFLGLWRLVLLVLVVGTNTVVVSLGSFGRRPLLAVALGLLWGILWSGWNRPNWKVSLRVRLIAVTFGIVAFWALALFSSTRQHAAIARQRGAREMISAVASGEFRRGALMLLRGQDTGSASMWIIENYPSRFEYQYLQALIYAVVYPIPRTLWEGKPWPLSNRLHYEAGFRAVTVGSETRGPGIIGHAFAEGGWVVVLIYGILVGCLLKTMDRLAFVFSRNPIIVCSIMSGLGQLMALPRGDSGSAAWRFAFTVMSSLSLAAALAYGVSRLVALIGVSTRGGITHRIYAGEPDSPVVGKLS